MLDTKLSVREIQLAIRNCTVYCNPRNDIIVPNVSWGLLSYEADLLVVRKSGVVLEFEIKRSFQDFKKDFEKFHTHESCTYFYYVVPEKIKDKVRKFLMEKFDTPRLYPAVLMYDEIGNLRLMEYTKGVYGNDKKNPSARITEEQKVTLGRLASIRYWNIVNEIAPNGYSEKDRRIKSLNEEVKKLTKENDFLYSLKGSGEWIRTSVAVPNDDRDVLVRHIDGSVEVGHYDNSEKLWFDKYNGEIKRFISNWAEIPAFQN